MCVSDWPNVGDGEAELGLRTVEHSTSKVGGRLRNLLMDRMLCNTYAKRDGDPRWPHEGGCGAKAEARRDLRMARPQYSSTKSITLP